MTKIIADNLRRLRKQKNYTQEYVAEKLNISPKSISRWECGITMPDVIILPDIAKLFCVTVDDLYKEKPNAYETYAHRLMAVYEATHCMNDFINAEREYSNLIISNNHTMKDMCMYAMLYQFHIQDCIDKSIMLFNDGLNMGIDNDPDTYHWIERQKMLLLSQIGKSNENVAVQTERYNRNPNDLYNCINLIVAQLFSGNNDKALEIYIESDKKFTNPPILHIYGGWIYKNLEKYDKAIECWNKSLQVDTEFTAAMRAKAECYEELGEYRNAIREWKSLSEWLSKRGYDIESDEAHKNSLRCLNMIESNQNSADVT